MTMNDRWLIERAQIHKAAAHAKQPLQGGRAPLPPIDDLWAQLQKETQRQAAVYTGELGDPSALVVETRADDIDVRTPDGRQLIIHVDRERRTLSETYRNAVGATRRRRALAQFARDASGALTFNFGGLQGAAGSIVRRMIVT